MNTNVLHIISVIEKAMKPHFSTTLDVIQRVMGVPMAAVQAIARNAGIDDEMQVGACIDENALSYFADAYVRKVKTYFIRTRAVYDQLGADEQLTFLQFCNEFNKIELPFPEASTWNDIDVDAIREQFYYDVKKLTPKEVSLFGTRFETLAIDDQNVQDKTRSIHIPEERAERRAIIMRKVTRSYLINARLRIPKIIQNVNDANHLLPIIAHYHIYISSDEDHSVDVSDYDNCLNKGAIIHRTLQMAS